MTRSVYKITALFLAIVLLLPNPVFCTQGAAAGASLNLLTTTAAFAPPLLKGIKVDPQDPFKFYFILDTGTGRGGTRTALTPEQIKSEGEKLTKYFLSALTIPRKDLWVNLSPYEQERIIPDTTGQTDLGEALLTQDYLLKQLAASLTYPESEAGEKYWDAVDGRDVIHHVSKQDAINRVSTTETKNFQKVWIMPDYAEVYQEGNAAFITKARLKVMMEEDYLAMQKNNGRFDTSRSLSAKRIEMNGTLSDRSTAAFKANILPLIEKEVNEGERFAPLRQVFYALTLALWYKENLKQTIFNQQFADKSRIRGIDSVDKAAKEKIYNQYLQAFQKGAYDYVKKECVRANNYSSLQKITKRRYFSGGFSVSQRPYIRPAADLGTPKPTGEFVRFAAAVGGGAGKHTTNSLHPPTAYKGLNPAVLAQMERRQVEINSLPEGLAKTVLQTLRDYRDEDGQGIPGMIYGGAVRDLVTATEKKEGDLDVILAINGSGQYSPYVAPELYRDNLLSLFRNPLERMARALGTDSRTLALGRYGRQGVVIDPLAFTDDEGEIHFRGVGMNIFQAMELSINRIGIDITGKVIDPEHGVEDFRRGILRLVGDLRMTNPQTILRALRFALAMEKYGFKFDRPSEEHVYGFFYDQEASAPWQRTIVRTKTARKLLREADVKIRENLRNPGKVREIINSLAKELAQLRTWVEVRDSPQTIEHISEIIGSLYKLEWPHLLSPLDNKQNWPALDIIMKTVAGAAAIYKAELNFTGDKDSSNMDPFRVGLLVADVYRAAGSPALASAALRKAGMEDLLVSCFGIELAEVEREYAARFPSPLPQENVDTGGVNMTKDDFVKFSGSKSSGAIVSNQPEGITIETLRPTILEVKPLKTVREFFTR